MRAAFIILCLALAAPSARAKNKIDQPNLFEPTALHEIHFRLSAEHYDAMQPQRGRARGEFWSKLRAATRPASRPATAPAGRQYPVEPVRNSSYVYVPADCQFDSKTLEKVALRYKGNTSYDLAAPGDRRPLKIDLERYHEQSLGGVGKFNLHNAALDPSDLREAISYEVFRQAGVPAPRTSFALVYLSVEGRFERRCIGLYTLVEEVDGDFLKRHFKTRDGLLLKPEGGLPNVGGDPRGYLAYQPKAGITDKTAGSLQQFSQIVHSGTPEEFAERIASVMEIDNFARFLAATVLLANMDSLLSTHHNFYLHVHPETGRVSWMPWDLNISLGGYQRMGTCAELAELSIDHPWVGRDQFLARMMAMTDFRLRYEQYLREFCQTFFTPERLERRIGELRAVVERGRRSYGDRPELRPVLKAPRSTQPFWPAATDVLEFSLARRNSVLLQLAGEDGGFHPRHRSDSIGGHLWGQRPPTPPAITPRLRSAIDTDKDGKLTYAEVLASAIAWFDGASAEQGPLDGKAIEESLAPLFPQSDRTANGRRGMPQPSAAHWRDVILFEGDRNLDGRLTRAELLHAAKRLFLQRDINGDGVLDEAEFSDAAARLGRA